MVVWYIWRQIFFFFFLSIKLPKPSLFGDIRWYSKASPCSTLGCLGIQTNLGYHEKHCHVMNASHMNCACVFFSFVLFSPMALSNNSLFHDHITCSVQVGMVALLIVVTKTPRLMEALVLFLFSWPLSQGKEKMTHSLASNVFTRKWHMFTSHSFQLPKHVHIYYFFPKILVDASLGTHLKNGIILVSLWNCATIILTQF